MSLGWAIGAVLSCLAPGPQLIKAEKYCLLECMGQIKESGSELFSLHIKTVLLAEFFSVFKNGLAQEGAERFLGC